MKYRYVATDATGKRQKGEVEAESLRAARQIIKSRSWQLMDISPQRAVTWTLSRKSYALSPLERVILTRQLAVLLSASLPLAEALEALSQQCEKAGSRVLIGAIRQQVLEGATLSFALSQHPRTFGKLYCALVKAGEMSGHLPAIMTRLADYMEQSQGLKRTLLQAMVYPVVLTVAAIAIIAILLTAVVPKIIEQFIHLKHELPLSTRILMGLSDVVAQYGPGLLLTLLLMLLALRQWLTRPENRLKWDAMLLQLPLVGKVIVNLNMARFARTLSILINSAVPALEAMEMGASVVTNSEMGRRLNHAQKQVREGCGLAKALNETALLSPMMKHMITSGENSGELENMLERAADIEEKAFQGQITLAVSVFTPLLVMVMAAMVFFIVLAILQPVLQLNNLVR